MKLEQRGEELRLKGEELEDLKTKETELNASFEQLSEVGYRN